MAANTDEQSTVTPSSSQSESNQMDEKEHELKRLCLVLGIDFNAKKAEFGSTVDEERLDEALKFLKVTRNKNFLELQNIASELIDEWKLSNTPFRKMCKFSWILYILDAVSSEKLSGEKLLSTTSVKLARTELENLRKKRYQKLLKNYDSKKKKIQTMLLEAHLTAQDIRLQAKEKVSAEEYGVEKAKLKRMIKMVKELTIERKELILRVELAKLAVNNAWPLEDIKDLVYNAKDVAESQKGIDLGDEGDVSDEESGVIINYDGTNVEHLLDNLYARARKEAADRVDKERNKNTSGTRSGKNYKPSEDEA